MRLPSPPVPEVVDRHDRLVELSRHWLQEPAVGLDTEFVRERTYYPRLGLIQVADSSGCYLVDAVAIRDLEALATVVRSEAVVKVFHSPSEDLEICHHAFGVRPERLFDCQVAAALCGLGGSLGYVHLVSQLFEVELAKGAQRSNWLRRPLSENQVRYAGLDVAYLLPAHEVLSARLAELGRREWAEEEFGRQLRASEARLGPEWSYSRLRRPSMSRRQLAALRAVCEWREKRARTRDVPRGFILKDETVVDIARRLPRSGRELAAAKGIGAKQARRHAPALLASLRGAASLAEHALPKRRGQGRRRLPPPLVDGLRKLVAGVASDLGIPGEALVPRRVLEAWAAASLERGGWVWPDEIEGWRRSVLESEVRRAGLLESASGRAGDGRDRRRRRRRESAPDLVATEAASSRGAGRESRNGGSAPALVAAEAAPGRGDGPGPRGGRGEGAAEARAPTKVRVLDASTEVDGQAHTIEDLYRLFGDEAPPAVAVSPGDVPLPQRDLLSHEKHMTVTLEAHHGVAVDVVVLDRVASDRHYARKILLRRAPSAAPTRTASGGVERLRSDSEPFDERDIRHVGSAHRVRAGVDEEQRLAAGRGGGEARTAAAGAVVQFGIVLLDLRFASPQARREILAERTPLGHVLIRHRRLRRISTHSLLEIEPDAEMRRHFGLPMPGAGEETRVFGRLATIFCDEEPAVELLEVLPPGTDAVAVSPGRSATS